MFLTNNSSYDIPMFIYEEVGFIRKVWVVVRCGVGLGRVAQRAVILSSTAVVAIHLLISFSFDVAAC